MKDLTVRDLGELGLLNRLRQFCPSEMIGDDAAVLTVPSDKRLVVTTDVLVEGVHFSDRTTPPEDVGWRAVAANLSDLAAMGAEPLGITIGLSLPGDCPVAWVEGLYQGMGECLQRFGGEIVGGDLCRAKTVSVAITALGSVEPARALYRTGARPGQAIMATGYHGSSRAGLEVLLHPDLAEGVSAAAKDRWITAHRRPHPRFDAVQVLQDLLPTGEAIAAMDTSDGLANAVMQIAQMSNVGAAVEQAQLPIDPDLVTWQGDQAVEWALYGGGDFELVLCVPPAVATELVRRLGDAAAIVGSITEGKEVLFTSPAGDAIPLSLEQGFQHF
ncbi:thiamine-phosphate kinase [filamentous cyanobacterium CCP5]|nr:thiamine-phosphate kinase [filamentous cyanobacterium CCP5]